MNKKKPSCRSCFVSVSVCVRVFVSRCNAINANMVATIKYVKMSRAYVHEIVHSILYSSNALSNDWMTNQFSCFTFVSIFYEHFCVDLRVALHSARVSNTKPKPKPNWLLVVFEYLIFRPVIYAWESAEFQMTQEKRVTCHHSFGVALYADAFKPLASGDQSCLCLCGDYSLQLIAFR